MVLSNSTPNNNHKQHELVVDTAAMNSADLSELIQLNAEIEERRSRHAYSGEMSDASGLLRATMTREELFEVSSMDDDRFLTALEHQNSYEARSRIQITDLDLSSIENLMKYFDEEVPVTPSKATSATVNPCSGKVASVIAKLAREPVTPPKQKVDSGKLKKISELKQKYEQQAEQLATPQAVRGAGKTSSMLPMKVKEMAQLFNSKFNQVMRRNDASQYSMLQNELSLSPEAKAPPQPQPRQKTNQQPKHQEQSTAQGPCLVAEDVFRELSVKDKVLLFNKFVSDIAARHPKFNEHADDLKAQAKKQMARGEVVAEQQASVKHLAKELEAKCVLHATPPKLLSTVSKSNSYSSQNTPSMHVSTLTVVIKASPERHVIALPGQQVVQRDQSSSQKRNLSAIRSMLPTEAYAPPKKIRRTRQERAGNDSHPFFQNEPLESLFYSWLSSENGVLFDITSVSNKEQTIEIASSDEAPAQVTVSSIGDLSQKSAVERLLEEAIAKLELENKTKESSYVEDKEVDTATVITTATPPTATPSPTTPATATPTPRKIKRQAPPVPAPRPSLVQAHAQAQTRDCITSSSSSSCKQSDAEESESGLSTLPKITSDESQPEMRASTADATEFDFTKPVRPPRKKKMRRTLTWKKENSIVEATANAVTSTDSESDYKPAALQGKKKPTNAAAATATAPPTVPQPLPLPLPEQSYIELDKSLMRQVNSPRKIKSAYTLTVMSSPSPNADSDQSPSQTPRQSFDQQQRDSFIDQGFETCSNDAMDSSPLRRPSLGMANAKPSGFSTPVKGRNAPSSAQQQLFSPIGQLDKPRRSSLAMQVIREDHPLDLAASSDTPTTPTCSEREFFANAPTVEMSSSQLEDSPATKPLSKFWINAGDFTVSLDIAHNSPERLRLLYEIFTQKSWETRELTFGIDGHKFCKSTGSVHETKPLPERPPSAKGFSHYWFASGDLAVPFSGKHMSSEKIERLYQFVEAELSSGVEQELRFGVDHFEFSNIPEFWHNSPKFSIESNYSMLVGLQTGNSNGLEGRSKYAWPNNQCNSSVNAIKTSDLDQTEFESDSFSNSGRLSFSPDLFSQDYEAVPLDELFDKTLPFIRSTPTTANTPTPTHTAMTMPQMLRTLQKQQTKLKGVEQRIKNYEMPTKINEATWKQCRNKPEYAKKLRAIDNIARSNGFRACSMEELESFMQFLIEYADVCLGNCSEHINKIIDSLLDQRAVAI